MSVSFPTSSPFRPFQPPFRCKISKGWPLPTFPDAHAKNSNIACPLPPYPYMDVCVCQCVSLWNVFFRQPINFDALERSETSNRPRGKGCGPQTGGRGERGDHKTILNSVKLAYACKIYNTQGTRPPPRMDAVALCFESCGCGAATTTTTTAASVVCVPRRKSPDASGAQKCDLHVHITDKTIMKENGLQ